MGMRKVLKVIKSKSHRYKMLEKSINNDLSTPPYYTEIK